MGKEQIRSGKHSDNSRFPARRRFRFMQDIYLNPDSDEELVRAARGLNSVAPEQPLHNQAVYAEIIEKLNEENRSLQLKLELAEAKAVQCGTPTDELTFTVNGENNSTESHKSDQVFMPEAEPLSSGTLPVTEPDLAQTKSFPPEEKWQLEINRQFEEWSLPEKVLGEERPLLEKFRDFVKYEVFKEWLAHHAHLLLITDLEGELLALSSPYRQALGDAVADGLTGNTLSAIFDETAVMLFLHSPVDRRFPEVVDKALLREVTVIRQTLVFEAEPVGYLFQLKRIGVDRKINEDAL